MKRHGFILAAITLIAVLLVTSCTPKPAPTPIPTPVAAAPTKAPTTAPPTLAPTTAPTAAPSTPAPAPTVKIPPVLSVATAGVGTTSYIVASAFNEVMTKNTGTKLTIEPSGATARYVPLMKTGDIDFAIGCDPSGIKEAYFGEYDWKATGPMPVTQVAVGQLSPYMFNVVDPNIKTLADLKGKKFYAFMKTMRILNEFVPMLVRESGVNPNDIEFLTYTDINEATKGIQDGKAVGVFYIPTVLPIVELDRVKPVYAIPVAKEVVERAQKEFPFILFDVWKKGDGISKADTPGAFLPCLMTARANLDPDIVYQVVKTIYSHYDDYKDKHPIMKEWTPQRAVAILTAPEHPGAIKYFKEAGTWKDAQEKLQQSVLAKPRG